jgi:hypothetical protein
MIAPVSPRAPHASGGSQIPAPRKDLSKSGKCDNLDAPAWFWPFLAAAFMVTL